MNKSKIGLLGFTLFFICANINFAQITDSDYNVLDYSKSIKDGDPISKKVLDKGQNRIIAELTLRDGKSTGKHTETIPFMVYGIEGSGELILGENEKTIKIEPGVFVTVESGIPHDVVAKPNLSILVFKLIAGKESKEKKEMKEMKEMKER